LKDDIKAVFHPGEYHPKQNHQVTKLSMKLDAFENLLHLTPYDHQAVLLIPPLILAGIHRVRLEFRNSAGMYRIPARILHNFALYLSKK
jgi:hypothetical protein